MYSPPNVRRSPAPTRSLGVPLLTGRNPGRPSGGLCVPPESSRPPPAGIATTTMPSRKGELLADDLRILSEPIHTSEGLLAGSVVPPAWLRSSASPDPVLTIQFDSAKRRITVRAVNSTTPPPPNWPRG